MNSNISVGVHFILNIIELNPNISYIDIHLFSQNHTSKALHENVFFALTHALQPF